MQIVRDLAGYSMGRSDLVRRAMAKKKHDVMAQEREYFVHGKLNDDGTIDVPGAMRNGVTEQAAEQLFDEMTAFASYAFNKSHAAAYGMVAVQTAWLKLHYPVEFMASLMNSVTGNTAKVAFYIQYCRKHGIEVKRPDVNLSRDKFTVDTMGGKKGIRFGMGAVKGVGHPAIQAIVAQAQQSPYTDIFDFVRRISGEAVNKKAVENLIRAGAMDSLPGARSQKLGVYEGAMDSESKRKKQAVDGQMSLFDFGGETTVQVESPKLPALQEFDKRSLLAMEKEVTGVYITGHPLNDYSDKLEKLTVNAQYLTELAEESADHGMSMDQAMVEMGGIITELKPKSTKSGSMMAFLQLEDLYGVTEVLVFPKVYERCREQLQPDSLVILKGKLSVREDEAIKLLLEKVRPLNSEPEKRQAYDYAPSPAEPAPQAEETRKLYLKLTAKQRLDAMAMLKKTPGRIRVMFYMADEKKTYAAPPEYWVSEKYDAAGLKRLLGESNVILK